METLADADGNGIVDAADYEVWKAHSGKAARVCAGSRSSKSWVSSRSQRQLLSCALLHCFARSLEIEPTTIRNDELRGRNVRQVHTLQ